MIFICHSSRDAATAQALCHYLEERDLLCWIAPRNISAGKEYAQGIMEGIEQSAVMVVIFSRDANESRHVRTEVERAFSRNIKIIPFKIQPIQPTRSLEYFLEPTHWLEAPEGKAADGFGSVYHNCSTGQALPQSNNHLPPARKTNRVLLLLSVAGILAVPVAYFSLQSKEAARLPAGAVSAALKDSSQVVPNTVPNSSPIAAIKKEIPSPHQPTMIKTVRSPLLSGLDGAIYIDGPTETEIQSADEIAFSGIDQDNHVQFSGKSGIYHLSGEMTLSGNTLKITAGNATGQVCLYDTGQVMRGQVIIKESGAIHPINLRRKP